MPHPSQFRLPGTNAAYVSTFAGDGFDWSAVRAQTGKDIYVVPNWQATEDNAANSGVQGLFSWYAWPSENNRPVNKAMSTEVDEMYLDMIEDEQKVYMAPVSPWCKLKSCSLDGRFRADLTQSTPTSERRSRIPRTGSF